MFKPRIPERKKITYSESIQDGQTLQDIIDSIPDGIDYSDCHVDVIRSSDYHADDFNIVYKVDEPDEEYNKRMRVYEKKKKEYDAWWKENGEEVTKKTEEIKQRRQALQRAKLETEEAALKAKLKKIEDTKAKLGLQ